MANRETSGSVHVSASAAEGLSDRQREILTAIIEVYIETAEPVGSRTLTKRKKLQVSPATVRNAMADLEELGLLSAPHASAGRVPTASGFRVYIERLAARGRITGKDRELIQAIVRGEGDQSSLRTVLEVAGRVLSSVSKHAALVLMPSLEDVVFEHIEFVPVRERSILTIFVAKSGLIQHRVLDVDFALNRDELQTISNYLNSLLGGKTLHEVRLEILKAMADERSQADQIMRHALYLGERTLRMTEPGMLLEGERTLLDQPEFGDIAKVRKLLKAFEEKTLLLRLLDTSSLQPVDAHAAVNAETLVMIGAESSVRDLKGLAAVTTSYSSEEGPQGRVGVVGPTRMDYSRVIPLVELTAEALSQWLRPSSKSLGVSVSSGKVSPLNKGD